MLVCQLVDACLLHRHLVDLTRRQYGMGRILLLRELTDGRHGNRLALQPERDQLLIATLMTAERHDTNLRNRLFPRHQRINTAIVGNGVDAGERQKGTLPVSQRLPA